MNLEMTESESQLLLEHLGHQIAHLDNELIHTDQRELQRQLAADIEQVRAIYDRLNRLVAGQAAAPV
jgi:hypothetical protein